MKQLFITAIITIVAIHQTDAQEELEWNWDTTIRIQKGFSSTIRDYGEALIIPVDPPTKHCLTETYRNRYRKVTDTLGVFDITDEIPERYFTDSRVIEPGYLIRYDSVSTTKIIQRKKEYIRAVKPVYGLPRLVTDYDAGINYVLLNRINVHKYDLIETICWDSVDEEFIDLVISKLDSMGYPVSQDYEFLDDEYEESRTYSRYDQRAADVDNKVGTYKQRNEIRQPKPKPLSNLADPDINQKILELKEKRMFSALRDYQYDRLLRTGYLDIETLRSLEIDLQPYELD